MNSTTYLSQAAREQLAAAQAALDTHVISSADGHCILCLVVGPCSAQSAAAVTFARYQMLPRRRPGATRPELISARRVHPSRRDPEQTGWFEIPSPQNAPANS